VTFLISFSEDCDNSAALRIGSGPVFSGTSVRTNMEEQDPDHLAISFHSKHQSLVQDSLAVVVRAPLVTASPRATAT
jgi:hypothetical protein